jgi:hypothetical protein
MPGCQRLFTGLADLLELLYTIILVVLAPRFQHVDDLVLDVINRSPSTLNQRRGVVRGGLGHPMMAGKRQHRVVFQRCKKAADG